MMEKSKNAPQIQEGQFKKFRLRGHDKKVLLDYQIPTQLEEIEKLADAVNKVLPDHDLAFAANLCLEELITNTILYGLKGADDRFIHVRISISNEGLEILLKDDAPQFDPFKQAPSPNLESDINKRPIGGLGVHLVSACTKKPFLENTLLYLTEYFLNFDSALQKTHQLLRVF